MSDPRDILGERDDAVPDRPTRVAEPSRESQLPKRFYTEVGVREEGDGYVLTLDGKPVRTPGKHGLAVSNETLAATIADEWDAQQERIDPLTMPLTRLANTAIDGVSSDMQAVKEDIVRFAGTDMLCYRADRPDALVERQEEAWDGLLDWAQAALGARFETVEGVMHIAQPRDSIAAFGAHVGRVDDPLVLTALHVVTSLTGSATLAMALMAREIDVETAWAAAHVDEDFNIEQWGVDEEAAARRAARFVDMSAAATVLENAA